MGRIRDEADLDKLGYWPLPSQKRFHESSARFKGFSGPVGSGKSRALCAEALRLASQNPGRSGLLGAPTYPMLKETTMSALFDLMANNDVPYEFRKNDNVVILVSNGARIILRSVNDYDRLRGTNLAWFGLDELTYSPQEAWLQLESRLRDPNANRLCGFATWTPKGYDWVYETFLAAPVSGYEAIIAPAFENHFVLDQVPDFYERLKRSYDETVYQQEVLGQYLSLQGGLVYKEFSRRDHLKPLVVSESVPLLWALDFNVDPMSSLVVQAHGGNVYVLDEIVLRHASTQEACENFERRFPNHAGGIVVYGDASGNSQNTTGASDYQIVREHFRSRYGANVSYKVPSHNPNVRDRIQLTNAKLRSAAGDIQLFVDPKCKELILDFEQVSYLKDSNAIDKNKDRKRTHLSDALGYLLWQECGPQLPIGEQRERLF